MKTDEQIMRILRKEDKIFRKLYNARKELDMRYPKTTDDNLARGKIYQAMLLLINKYRREHPEIEKK